MKQRARNFDKYFAQNEKSITHKHSRMINKEFAETEAFQLACKEAGVKPTTRQASKFRRREGLAYLTQLSKQVNSIMKTLK